MRILTALDGSEGAIRALRFAIDVAQKWGAELHSVSIEEIARHDGAVLPVSDESEWGDRKYAFLPHSCFGTGGALIHCRFLVILKLL